MIKRKLLALFLVFFGVSNIAVSSESNLTKKLPLESREVKWVDVITYKMPIDEKPAWAYDTLWQGNDKPRLFVTETPKYFYPMATFNAQHFSKKKAPRNPKEFKVFAYSAIENIAKNYGHNGRYIKGIKESKKGQLRGYLAVVNGKVEGEKKEVIIYIASAPDDSIFSLVAFTNPGKASHLKNTFDRMAINIEFPGGTLNRY